jgi:hypothetical protein
MLGGGALSGSERPCRSVASPDAGPREFACPVSPCLAHGQSLGGHPSPFREADGPGRRSASLGFGQRPDHDAPIPVKDPGVRGGLWRSGRRSPEST